MDLGGETVDKAGGDFKTAYNGNTIQNGTVNLSSVGDNENLKDGTFTIGSGANVLSTGEFRPNNNCTFNIIDGGTFSTAAVLCMPFRYGNQTFNLDNGTFTSSATATYTGGYCVNIGYMWNNKTVWSDNSAKVVLNNGSTFAVTEGTLGLGRVKGKEKKVNIKIDFAVTNSAVVVSKGQMVIANNTSGWVKEAANSYIKAVFGPGSEITTGQIYVDGAYPTASVTFDGATIHWNGNNSSFIGHHSAVGDVYEIQSNGLTIDIPSDKSLTCDDNASSLKGDGGITKVGEGSITWNKVSSNGSTGMTFTGPLVVSNGTWSSSLSYAATAFAVDGANSTLALSGTLTAAAPDMSATAGGTLNLQSNSVVSRTVGAMTLGEGATLAITGGGLGVDAISANTVVLTATAANPVKIEFDDAANISVGTHNLITITGGGEFAAGDETKFALDADAPEGSTLSVSGTSLVLTVPASNPATWTGGANDGLFSSVGNWLGNAVPGASDDVVISVASATTLDCDVPLNVNSITFPATSAKVTISGAGCITNAATIVNYSSARHVIDVPVEFVAEEAYAPIDVTGEVEFSGGVKGTLPANHSTFYGNYTLTATSWTLSSAITLAANATVTATGMELKLSGTNVLNAEAGSSMTVKYIKPTYADTIGSFAGILTATNQLFPEGANPSLSFDSGFTGVLKTKEIKYHTAGYSRRFSLALDPSAEVVLGGVGVNVMQGTIGIAGCSLRSSADWSFTSCKNGYNKKSTIDIGSAGITVDTSDYYDSSAAGHTVYVKTDNSNYSDDILSGTGGVIVNGNGQFVFQKSALFTGTLAVNDSVALNVNAGVAPGMGDVTLKDTATFNLAQSGTGTVPVSGTLTMAGGTALRIPTLARGVLPLSVNALAFDGVTAENKVALNIEGGELVPGFNAIIQSTTALPANAWDNFAVTLGATVPSGMETLYIAQGNTLYIVLKGGSDAIWSGGGETANFNNSDNWLGWQIPGNGSCVQIAAADEATLVNDIPGFSPASITFAAGSTAVTITGENAINVTSITNLSSASHTINVPVYFTGDIAVAQNARGYATRNESHITFAGGAYAAEGCSIAPWRDGYSYAVFGRYELANTEESPYAITEYRVSSSDDIRFYVAAGSTLNTPCSGNTLELDIADGGAVTASVTTVTSASTAPRLCHRNFGEFAITNEFKVASSHKSDIYAGWNAGTSAANVFKIEKATCNRTDGYTFYFAEGNGASCGTYYFGKGGINFGDGKGYFGIGKNSDGDAQTIRPWYSDFIIGTGAGNTDGLDMWMFRSITFNTDDENGIGRKITLNARPRFNYTPSFTVAGSGTVLVNSVASNNAEPPVTVKDSATLALAPGALLTKDTTTVASGATLAVAGSGTVAIGGDLTLADGACLGFNYSTRNAPVLDLTDKNVTLGDNKNIVVKITSENGKRAKSGKNVLTSGGNFAGANVTLAEGAPEWVGGISVEDGNIVLDVKREGLVLIIK